MAAASTKNKRPDFSGLMQAIANLAAKNYI